MEAGPWRQGSAFLSARLSVVGKWARLALIFYGCCDVRFVPLMFVSIAGNWYAARLFAATKNRAILTEAIVANLAVLGTFK
jgi:hypothetical protein